MTGTIVEVTMLNFEEIVDNHPAVILDFWAEWCAPCRVFAPIFEKMAELHPDVLFGKVNADAATELAQAFNVRAIPTIMAFKKSELIFEQSGILTPQAFESLLERLK